MIVMSESFAIRSNSSGRTACMLILPLSFYGFGQVLRRELEARGLDVVMENDEYPANSFGKLIGKLGMLRLLRWWTFRTFRRRYENNPENFAFVLIVKGRGVSQGLIHFLKSISKRIVAYNFDSFCFNPSPLDWLHDVDRYCTFDPEDALKHKLPLVHLFSAIKESAASADRRYEVTVLMKNHSQRLAYTDQVLSALSDHSRFIYIFEPNLFSFAWGVFRHPLLYLKYWNDIHFSPLSYGEFVRVLRESRVTVDYAHPSQTGLTIRCFEARSVGVALVTNNPYVLSHPAFDATTVVHFPLDGDPSLLAVDVQGLLDATSGCCVRTVEDFMSELLGVAAISDVATQEEDPNQVSLKSVGVSRETSHDHWRCRIHRQ